MKRVTEDELRVKIYRNLGIDSNYILKYLNSMNRSDLIIINNLLLNTNRTNEVYCIFINSGLIPTIRDAMRLGDKYCDIYCGFYENGCRCINNFINLLKNRLE
jgi:hypothetical protein